MCAFDLNKFLSVHFTSRALGNGSTRDFQGQRSRLWPFGRRHMFTYPTKVRKATLQGRTCCLSTAHYFHFRCALLSCNRGRIRQKCPNRLKHGAKSSRMAILPAGIAGAEIGRFGTSYFVGRRPEKGGAIFVCASGNFLSRIREP